MPDVRDHWRTEFFAFIDIALGGVTLTGVEQVRTQWVDNRQIRVDLKQIGLVGKSLRHVGGEGKVLFDVCVLAVLHEAVEVQRIFEDIFQVDLEFAIGAVRLCWLEDRVSQG